MINVQDKNFGRMGNRFFQLAYIYAQAREGNIPDIYLQDIKYFDKYRTELQEMFKQEGEPLDYVSIHVRRGTNPSVPTEPKYSDNPFYTQLDMDYYKKAMEHFPGENFMIFSDDREWAREHFKENLLSPAINNDTEDFNWMARCKGHVIANSSYSWWAAYLSGNKTVAPANWFANGTRINYPDWIVV